MANDSLRDRLHSHRTEILEIAAKHGAFNVRLFGSVGRGEERPNSDIDLLVDMADDRGLSDYLELAAELERLFGRKVDLLTDRSLSPFFRPFIEAEARPL